MEETERNLVLYILMRTDLPSMNPGKAMAQASHASNQFAARAERSGPDEEETDFEGWAAQAETFGTVLVLGVNYDQLKTAVDVASMFNFVSGLVVDPTYPYITTPEIADLIGDGIHSSDPIIDDDRAVLFREEITCGYVFGDKNDPMLEAIVGRFQLHP